MFGLGITEIVIILVVLGIVFFGGKKITEFAKSAGRFTGELKKGQIEVDSEIKKAKEVFEKTNDEKPKNKS